MNYIQARPIHCRLPRAMPCGLHCARVVPKVYDMQFILAYQTYLLSNKCLAHLKDLDNPVAYKNPYTLKHAKLLIENMELINV
jgi:hypothetical protein